MDKSKNPPSTSNDPSSSSSTTTTMMNRMRISSGNNNNNNNNNNTSSSSMYVAERFPVNSLQQITIGVQSNNNHHHQEVITGRVYCTDEITRTIILQKALTYTTLSSEIRIISLNSIVQSQILPEVVDGTDAAIVDNNNVARATPLTQPLPIIQKKVLEERERRAIRLAEESLRHINPKASPIGQAVFERLLKACGEVEWKDDTTSILVLKQIQVDAPYEPSNCTIIVPNMNQQQTKNMPSRNNATSSNGSSSMSLEEVSLDRVKKIVASAAISATAVVDHPNTTTTTTTAADATTTTTSS